MEKKEITIEDHDFTMMKRDITVNATNTVITQYSKPIKSINGNILHFFLANYDEPIQVGKADRKILSTILVKDENGKKVFEYLSDKNQKRTSIPEIYEELKEKINNQEISKQ